MPVLPNFLIVLNDMRLTTLIAMIIACLTLATQRMYSQDSLSHCASNLQVTADAGLGMFLSSNWVHQYSARAGVGTYASETILFRVYLQYDLYHSTKRWGDLEAQVFETEYRRNDFAAYGSFTFSRWVSIGAGVVAESTPDMHYHRTRIASIDTTIYTLRSSSTVRPFFLAGVTPEISITSDISIPIGIYFYSPSPIGLVVRIGLSITF